jgi:hypothetical protein
MREEAQEAAWQTCKEAASCKAGEERMSEGARTMSIAKTCTSLVACLTLFLLASASASASQTINAFSVTTTTTQAGGHPDVGMSFELQSPGEPESARDVMVNTPEGVFGSPNAIDKCNSQDFALEQCPSSSQAGLITVYANHGGNPNKLLGTAPIYNREAVGKETALFSFIVPTLNIPVSIPVAVRTTGDYGLRFTVSQLTQLAPLRKAKLTFWGFPADESNDAERFAKGSPGDPAGCPGFADAGCIATPVPAGITSKPMINNPSICPAEPLSVSIEVTTYQDPETPSTAESTYPASTGCYAMIFRPLLLATPTTHGADSPAGLDLTMTAPQPAGKATTPSPISSAVLTLPEGLTINPDAADGQSACADEAANFRSEGPANCPDNAKIGTFEVGSPALDGPLEGSIYIGEPKPGDQYRLFLIAEGFGINAKFIGTFRPDPVTGQVTAFIEDLPQVPFDRFELHLFASDRGLMATPTHCTLYEVQARFFPWNAVLPDQTSTQPFSIDSGPGGGSCPGQTRPFNPRLIAGTTNSQAGGFSDFALQLDRDDGDQFLGDLGFTMPPGFTGSLVGISYCSEAAIHQATINPGRTELANPSCPVSSQIGTTDVAAGPGSHPFNVRGRIYFSGPLKGAPLSLVAITPALAGPYDYGTQVVRVALHVDPLDAHVRAVSDTVPSIIGGVPIRLRTIRVNLDRPNFIINPTSCGATTIHSEGIGDQGTVTGFDSYFHPVNCFSLGFKPTMTMRQAGGRKDTRRARNPELQFDLTTRPGDANIKSLSVTLSSAFEIDQRHLGNICSEKELVATQCAGRTPIGMATTTTPLLDRPLEGPAYAVSGSGGLPRLAFILNGQVNLVPRADTVTVNGGRLQTTVPVVPDASIGHFHLTVFGGKTGYLINTRDICVHTPVTRVAYTAQSGKTRSEAIKVQAACGKKSKARHKRHRR